MITIAKIPLNTEKVNKAEKQSVLDDPRFRVGAEFEIEVSEDDPVLPDVAPEVTEAEIEDALNVEIRENDRVRDFVFDSLVDEYIEEDAVLAITMHRAADYGDRAASIVETIMKHLNVELETRGISELLEQHFGEPVKATVLFHFDPQSLVQTNYTTVKLPDEEEASRRVLDDKFEYVISVRGRFSRDELGEVRVSPRGVTEIDIENMIDETQDIMETHEFLENLESMQEEVDIYVESLRAEVEERLENQAEEREEMWNDTEPDDYFLSDVYADLSKIVGNDVDTTSSQGWHVEGDASLSSNGFELIAPDGGLPMDDFFAVTQKIFEYIDNHPNLRTPSNTGFHVGLSLQGVDLREELDMLKLALFMEEGKVWAFFQDRQNNRYTKSVLSHVQQAIKNGENVMQIRDDFEKDKESKEYKTVMQTMSKLIVPKQKMYGINFSKVDTGNYIEFRYLGGKGYHTKFDQIRSQILDFAYFLRLATDPDAKRKEYLKKLYAIEQEIKSLAIEKKFYNLKNTKY